MNKRELISVRDYMPGDKNFILATWLRGLFYGESWFSLIPKNVFMEHYHNVIEHILASKSTTVKVACLLEDPEVILGYTVLGSNNTVHWVFVKKSWRSIGIAKDLVPAQTKNVTHLTKTGLSIIRAKDIDFNPFLV